MEDVDERLAILVMALQKIRDSKYCLYEETNTFEDKSYGTGVTDGHRWCARVSADALDKYWGWDKDKG